MPQTKTYQGPVIAFDGVCNLCNGFVNFLIRIDKHAVFRFYPMQSVADHDIAAEARISKQELHNLSSVILIEYKRLSVKSDAVLRISSYLPWPWRALKFFRFVPASMRDAIYDLIARNRYRWFGRKKQCMIPTPEVMDRFVGEKKPDTEQS